MEIRELMTPDPVNVSLSTSVAAAWDVLRKLDVRHLPVVDSDGELVGIVSDRDFGNASASPLLHDAAAPSRFLLDAPIARIMSVGPLAVGPSARVQDVVRLMVEHKMGAIPVVDVAGRVVGIVSYLDILRNLELVAAPDPLQELVPESEHGRTPSAG